MVSLRTERQELAARVRRSRIRIGVAVGVVLLAVAAIVVLAGGKPTSPGRSAYDAGTTDPVVAAVPVLAGYAEQARGLKFRSAPPVKVVTAAAFAAAAKEQLTLAGSGDQAATARALGLTGTATTPTPAAVYSYKQHAVFLRAGGAIDGPALVGALTLALQDQNFDLLTAARTAAQNPDSARALAALIQGDAARIQAGYPAGGTTTNPAAPASYGQLAASFPATTGRDFVAALAQQGGNAAVDAAFRRPPESTAQVIDPKAYQDGREPLGVRAPPGEGQRVDAGTLGEFGLAALITGGRRVVDAGSAGQWLGDSYGTFRTSRGLCTFVNVVLADADAREQAVRDLARWAAARGGRAQLVRSADRGLRLSSCA